MHVCEGPRDGFMGNNAPASQLDDQGTLCYLGGNVCCRRFKNGSLVVGQVVFLQECDLQSQVVVSRAKSIGREAKTGRAGQQLAACK